MAKLIRRREVRKLTGWSDKYITKLVMTGVLRTWHPPRTQRAQAWFYREEIEDLLAGNKTPA